MKNFLLVLCLLISANIFCQENKKWAVEMTSSIDQYFIQLDEYERYPISGATGFHLDKQKINYTLGFSFIRKLNPNIAIGLGFQYSNRDIEGHCYCDFCDKLPVFNQLISIDFLEVPLFLNYTLGKDSNKLRPYLKVGLTTSKVLNEAFTTSYKKLHFSGLLGVGGRYKINDRFSISLESYYEQMFRSISEYSEYKYKSVSFQFGVQTTF